MVGISSVFGYSIAVSYCRNTGRFTRIWLEASRLALWKKESVHRATVHIFPRHIAELPIKV